MLPWWWFHLCKNFKNMIKELVNFIEDLERNDPEIHQKNVELKEGLYLFIRFEEGGKISIVNQLPYYEKKVGEVKITKEQVQKAQSKLYQRCLSLQQVLLPVAPTKIFDTDAKIFGITCSPFALGFNKKNIDGKSEDRIKQATTLYFKSAKRYVDLVEEELKLQFLSWFNIFSDYCKQNLMTFLDTLDDYKTTKKGGVFNVFLILEEPNYNHFKVVYDVYFDEKIFNKEVFNKKNSEGLIHGVPDSLFTYNDKKSFLKHQSAPFNLKYRTSGKDARIIWQFYKLYKHRILPNPLPIFLDKKDLNGEVISLYNEEKIESFAEVIRSLFIKHKEDLGGYYLLFIQKGEIIDLDFVSNFQYYLYNCELKQTDCLNCNYINKKKQKQKWKLLGKIDNVFEFQNRIVSKIFNSILVSPYEDGLNIRYFTDFSDSKDKTLKSLRDYVEKILHCNYDNTVNIILKYRLAFYNYIYKSQRKDITKILFDDVMINGIMDDLRKDEVKDNYHTKQFDIKEKLLIWFSLHNFFNQNNKNNKDMINLTQQFFDTLKSFAKGKDLSIEVFNPELFAFASGQLIREILQKSKSDKRTHALLEPFLQKTDINLFKLAIARTFETYKHEFTLYNGNKRYEFDRIMALVMGATDTAVNIKDLLPFTLAGYFSDSIFAKETVSEELYDSNN
jgi:CRISPR-associated protein Csh1